MLKTIISHIFSLLAFSHYYLNLSCYLTEKIVPGPVTESPRAAEEVSQEASEFGTVEQTHTFWMKGKV